MGLDISQASATVSPRTPALSLGFVFCQQRPFGAWWTWMCLVGFKYLSWSQFWKQKPVSMLQGCSFFSSLFLEFSLLKPGFLKSPCSTFLFIHLTLSKFHSIALDSWLEPKILWEDLSSFNYFLLSSPQALFFLLYHCYMNLSIQWSTHWQF